jgi:dipeptidase
MSFRKCLLLLLFSFLVSETIQAQQIKETANCFSMLIGKEASADGAVYLAHNEDDWGDLYVDWHKVPRMKHNNGAVLELEKGGLVDQVSETSAYLWLQMPGMQFSDSYLNEYGVSIASNQCRSREDNAELTDGGIGYYLRRIMAERSKTAREAVRIGGELVERFGYHYSGRTYLVADKDEAWMMAVVRGKHWVAQRIPDDHIAIIPNYYTIQEIDLADTLNFLGANDIVTYAVKRGWFDTTKSDRFNFREAYAATETIYGIWNIPRHLDALNQFLDTPLNYGYDLPFSIKPEKKVSLSALMDVMDAHGEGTQFEVPANYKNGNPHKTVIKRVCSEGNQYAMIAQLRKNLPDPLAHVLWIAPKRPCIQSFTPWYIGLTEIPGSYTRGMPHEQLKRHFSDDNLKSTTSEKAYWTFKALADKVDENYGQYAVSLFDQKMIFQREILDKQAVFEKLFTEIYKKDLDSAIKIMNEYVSGLASTQLENTKVAVDSID